MSRIGLLLGLLGLCLTGCQQATCLCACKGSKVQYEAETCHDTCSGAVEDAQLIVAEICNKQDTTLGKCNCTCSGAPACLPSLLADVGPIPDVRLAAAAANDDLTSPVPAYVEPVTSSPVDAPRGGLRSILVSANGAGR